MNLAAQKTLSRARGPMLNKSLSPHMRNQQNP